MKYLTLIRHAKSSWKDRGSADIERELNARGEHDCVHMGHTIARELPVPAMILGSSAQRVRQTVVRLTEAARRTAEEADALARKTKAVSRPRGDDAARSGAYPEPEWRDELYLADAETLWDIAYSALLEADEVWICAHNPGITEAVEVCTGSRLENIPTLGVCRIAFEELVPAGANGTLVFYATPRNYGRRTDKA